ncbi:MAG: helix-turn-helix domain-containing protein [Desulfitobacteriaceae bacterium]
MENIQLTVGQNIKYYRQVKGFTQEDLAEKVDVSGSYIGYLERGKKCPSLELLGKIAESLYIEPALLLTPKEQLNDDLKRLISLLSGKAPYLVAFISDVASAYFRSLKEHETYQSS